MAPAPLGRASGHLGMVGSDPGPNPPCPPLFPQPFAASGSSGPDPEEEKGFPHPGPVSPPPGHVAGGFGHPGTNNAGGERPRSPWQPQPAKMTFLPINRPLQLAEHPPPPGAIK